MYDCHAARNHVASIKCKLTFVINVYVLFFMQVHFRLIFVYE